MVSLQYIGQSHTLIFLPGEKVKTKVSEGEIIDIEIDEKEIKRYQLAGFQVVGEEAPKAPKTPAVAKAPAPAKVAKPKAPKAPKTPKK